MIADGRRLHLRCLVDLDLSGPRDHLRRHHLHRARRRIGRPAAAQGLIGGRRSSSCATSCTVYRSAGRSVRAVDGVSFDVAEGEVLRAGRRERLRQERDLPLDPSAVRGRRGQRRAGLDHLRRPRSRALSEREMRSVRGRDISIIFQDPMTSLNPTMRIGEQIEEGLRRHRALARRAARRAAAELLGSVGVPSAAARLDSWPHEFSRRHAPARHDRHRARLPAEAADRRRADDGARRHDPGSDPQADPAPQASSWA